MSGRPLLLVTLPVLTVLAICLYLRRRAREDADPPEPPPPDQPAAAGPAAEPAAEPSEQTAGQDLGQVTAWVRDNIETCPEPEQPAAEEPAVTKTEQAAVSTAPTAVRQQPEGGRDAGKSPEAAAVGPSSNLLQEIESAIQPAQKYEQDCGVGGVRPRRNSAVQETPVAVKEAPATTKEAPVTAKEAPATQREASTTTKEVPATAKKAPATTKEAPATAKKAPTTTKEAPVSAQEASVTTQEAPAAVHDATVTTQEMPVAVEEAPVTAAAPVVAEVTAAGGSESGAEAAAQAAAEPSEPAVNGHHADMAADTASENSSDSGKGGSSASLEQASPSNTPESAALQTAVYDFLIPQKLCGRLIGKNGTFVNMLKGRTGAHVIIRQHPVKSSVKICSVDGTQSEIDACLKMIREKFPLNKFPAMTLEQLNRPTEQTLAVPDSQQLHLPQGVTCDVLVSAVVSAGQLFLQQLTHPTFRGLERLSTLMNACYADGQTTPELPRPVLASSICAAPVAGGWYRAQVVAFYPDTDELDVRFMDFGGYSRIPAAHARQIRTDFMSLPFQAEECYLANVMPMSEDGWSLESGAVFENLITDRALEAMVVGYAEDGTPFVNLYSIQGTEYGNNAISLVNQQLVDSGAARWVENQA